jgi:D-beta-D-heptose 7-phosphate kinase/D-beta-D-heptose 1-phosphate adenosyltransferase
MGTQLQNSWKVVLIGDACQDVYHYGRCHRLSPEAPVPVFCEERVDTQGGMSKNVLGNLIGLGISVIHYSNDPSLIQKHRCIDLTYNQQIFRRDVEEKESIIPISIRSLDAFKDIDAIVISDYDKGYVTKEFASELTKEYSKIPIFVDTKKKDISCYENSIIKVNYKENSEITRWPKNSELIVTLGGSGALYDGRIFPTEKVDIFDVCGAGDVFLAGLVYGYLKNKSIKDGIKMGNKLASVSVTKRGVYTVTQADL